MHKQKTNENTNAYKTYTKTSLKIIFFARMIDIILVSIIPAILVSLIKIDSNQWIKFMILMIASFSCLFLYFVFIPWLCKGNTLGKLIWNIRLRSKENYAKFWQLFLRELWFIFIPWMIITVGQIIAILIMLNGNHSDDPTKNGLIPSQLIVNLMYTIFLLWFLINGISIGVQEDHQAGIDMKLNLFVINKIAIEDRKHFDPMKNINDEAKNKYHVHLKELHPGQLSEENLQKISELDDNYHRKNNEVEINDN
ncbi:RDD family protein [Spiroplasma endosymbiont of Labia minor]|uniref:RDD family protein n=1 Tax=Spiroplasma endosymbiont of Labia minor TaxID=3066305 RepID=UPI0030D17DF0